MMRRALEAITPERFEELAKELLCVDGFKNVIVHAKGTDGGVDLAADKSIPIAHGREHHISWLVQCKHVSTSRALPGTVVEQILANFVTQTKYEGLLIITNTKLTASALDKIRELVRTGHRPICHWDVTDIEQILREHPFLMEKFGIGDESQLLPGASSVRTLLLSDGSVFAYHVYDSLRKHGFNLRETRLHHFGSNALYVPANDLWRHFDVALVFLAEIYWLPLSVSLIDGLRESIANGLRAVFTPFCAWSVGSGVNPTLDALLPVTVERREIDVLKLLLPDPPDDPSIANRVLFPMYSDTFIENQQTSIGARMGEVFSATREYSGRSTYEFLRAKPGADIILSDSNGNPVLVSQDQGRGRIAYLNMCAHNCMTPYALRSPVDGNAELQRITGEFVLWLASRQ
jgi:hypothetical protein